MTSTRPRRASRVARIVALAAALALPLAGPREAHAFCRTTTVPVEAGYDPSVSGCWPQGTPLAWPLGTHVGYLIDQTASSQIDLASVEALAASAFEQWNQAPCSFGRPDIQASSAGTVDAALVAVDCGLVHCGETVHDPNHVITFRDQSWPSNDPTNTLALTIVTYGVNSGTIFDADIEINSSQHLLSATEPPAPMTFDLQSILTHEAGHFLGLAHSNTTDAVMYAYYMAGSLELKDDDVAGICAVYKPSPPASGCAVGSSPASSNAVAVSVALGLAALLGARLRRRAPSPDRRLRSSEAAR